MAKPLRPEPKYFLKTDRELSYATYLRQYFPGHTEYRILGEKSVSYLEKKDAALRIKALLPGVKIVIILRDPVIRALSNYWFTRNNGLEDRSLNEAFTTLVDKPAGSEMGHVSVSPYSYLGRGRYLEFIDAYANIFTKKRLYIGILENLADHLSELQQLYKFLGVDTAFVPSRLNFSDNESEKTDEYLSAQTMRRLIDYYGECNQRLAKTYALDISRWLK